jgi:predicted ATP-grasp superfamily ATP-dependent carboligase
MKGDSVLVLDSQGPNGLALCRTLGKKGLSVTAGGNTAYLPGMLSRYTDDSYVHPDAGTHQSAFVDHLEEHLTENDYAAVFPVTDMTTGILSQEKARLEATGTPVGAEDWETFLDANDKGRLFELVEEIDVPSPETHVPKTMADVEAIAAERTQKVVIKPRRTTFTGEGGESRQNRLAGSNYVELNEDLTERFQTLLAGNPTLEAEYPIIQEFVPGVGTMATVGLADEGELLAFFQHEKFRVYPPSGGIGAVRKGVWEPKMREYTERIVELLEWTGPLHVEFMKTHDGDFYLIEVNGRYWGSLALTINSGVDIPWYHYQLLTGNADGLHRPNGYRTDVKQRKLFYQDIRWLRERLSRRKVGALLPFTASFFTTRDEFLDPDDPAPFLGLVPRSVYAFRNRERGIVDY